MSHESSLEASMVNNLSSIAYSLEESNIHYQFKAAPHVEKRIREFIFGQATSTEDFSYHSRRYPAWRHNLTVYAIDQILTSNQDYERVALEPRHDNCIAFDKKEIEIGPGKKQFVPYSGYVFIQIKSLAHKFILYISPADDDFEGEARMGIYTRAGDEEQSKKFFSDIDAWITQNNFYKGRAIDPGGEFLNIKKLSWDDLILEDSAKEKIKRNIVGLIEKNKLYQKYGIATKRGALISGPPGTGKSMLGKILANQVPATFIWATPQFLIDARCVEAIFKMARELAPSIIFFEDADLYAKDRETEDNRSAVLGEILNQMDGIVANDSVVTIMTTNYPKRLEGKALTSRPGRIELEIKLDCPSKASRKKMYEYWTKDCITKNVDFESLAAKEPKGKNELSGAHCYETINYGKMLALDEGSLDNEKIILTDEILNRSLKQVIKNFDGIQEAVGFVAEDTGGRRSRRPDFNFDNL